MYSASKVFLKNLSRALSVELKPRGITVTAVCPGWVDTQILLQDYPHKTGYETMGIDNEEVCVNIFQDSIK